MSVRVILLEAFLLLHLEEESTLSLGWQHLPLPPKGLVPSHPS